MAVCLGRRDRRGWVGVIGKAEEGLGGIGEFGVLYRMK